MSFFLKGDYKIQQSWQEERKSRKSKRKSNPNQQQNLMMKLGMNLEEPSTDIIDDSLSKLLMKQISQEHHMKSTKGSHKISQPLDQSQKAKKDKFPKPQIPKKNDDDLLTSLTKRLQQLEKTCQNQRKQIRQKNEAIQKVKTENAFLKGMREDQNKTYQEMNNLKKRNDELQKKVRQMEDYLKQYGLKWVGSKASGSLDHQKMKKDIAQAKNLYRLPSQIDFSTIQRRISELNMTLEAEGQGTQVYSENGVHKFRRAEPLAIAFFSNGILIKTFNFFAYKSKQSLKILSDLVDGYFPYIFKKKYPEGVYLEAIDMIEKVYSSQLEQRSNKIEDFDTLKQKGLKPQTKEQFLNKLPKQIIKNGKVLPIREEIEKLFQGKIQQEKTEDSEHCENVDGDLLLKTQCYKQLCQNTINEEQVCALKIRTEDGQIFYVKMYKNDKIINVFCELRKVVRENFKLIGNFPRREYNEEQRENLESLGFFPNANLYIQSLKK